MRVNKLLNILSYVSMSAMLFISSCENRPSTRPTNFTKVDKCNKFDGKDEECTLAITEAGVHCTPTANNTCIEVPAQSSPSTGRCEEIADIANCVYYACKDDNGTCKTDKPGKCANLDGHETECKLYEPDAICKWNAGNNKCEKAVVVLTKYHNYDFNVLPLRTGGNQLGAGGFALNIAHIQGVVSSKNHSNVYVLKANGGASAVYVTQNNGVSWDSVAINSINTPAATGNNQFDNLSDFQVYAPLENGVVIGSNGYGFFEIEGNTKRQVGAADRSWLLAQANIAGANRVPTSFFQAKNTTGDLFTYATNSTTAQSGVVGHDNTAKDAFDVTIEINTGGPLTVVYTALGQITNGDLVMGNTAGVYTVPAASIGTVAAQMAQAEGAPIKAVAALNIDGGGGTANDQGINDIAHIDGKYLVLAFVSSALANGGIVVLDTSDPAWPVHKVFGNNLQMTAKKVVPSLDGKGAMITSNKGIVYFHDGDFVTPKAGKELMNMANVNDTANRVNHKAKASAASGFAGYLVTDNILGAAQDSTGRWYFGSTKGIITLDIIENEI